MKSQPTHFEFANCFSNSPPITLTPAQEERLFFLIGDDENSALLIKQLLSFVAGIIEQFDKGDTTPKPSPVNPQNYQGHLKISEFCKELANVASYDFGPKAKYLFMLMERFYRLKAETLNPKGKRQRRVDPRSLLAHLLISMLSDEELDIPFAVNPQSDLSRLFRICCEIIGLEQPSNTAFYLKPEIDKMDKAEDSEMQRLDREICAALGIEYPGWL